MFLILWEGLSSEFSHLRVSCHFPNNISCSELKNWADLDFSLTPSLPFSAPCLFSYGVSRRPYVAFHDWFPPYTVYCQCQFHPHVASPVSASTAIQSNYLQMPFKMMSPRPSFHADVSSETTTWGQVHRCVLEVPQPCRTQICWKCPMSNLDVCVASPNPRPFTWDNGFLTGTWLSSVTKVALQRRQPPRKMLFCFFQRSEMSSLDNMHP